MWKNRGGGGRINDGGRSDGTLRYMLNIVELIFSQISPVSVIYQCSYLDSYNLGTVYRPSRIGHHSCVERNARYNVVTSRNLKVVSFPRHGRILLCKCGVLISY